MDLAVFLLHFMYIAGTFIAGLAVGFIFKEKLEKLFAKFYSKK